jgi:hypothetical protein
LFFVAREGQMFDQHIYNLGSVASNEAGNPEIFFEISVVHFAEFLSRVRTKVSSLDEHALLYFGKKVPKFVIPSAEEISGLFGYGGCAIYSANESHVKLTIPMKSNKSLAKYTMTLHVIVSCLFVKFETFAGSNERQQSSIYLLTNPSGGYAHGVEGYISEQTVVWIQEYAKAGTNTQQTLPPEVVEVMQAVFKKVCIKEVRKYASDAGGWIRKSGALTLRCFGDSCDLSVYPDAFGWQQQEDKPAEMPMGFVAFGCHNLDVGWQQLTLVAGFAKLCELARN